MRLKWQRLEPCEKFAVMIDRYWDGIAAYCRLEKKVSLGLVDYLKSERPGHRSSDHFHVQMARRSCWELILSCALIIAAGISYQGERIARIVDEDTLNQRRIEALVSHQGCHGFRNVLPTVSAVLALPVL